MGDTRAVWSEQFAAQAASGLSIAAFCRRHGLSYAHWMYWKRRLAARTEKPGLLPIHLASSASRLEVEVVVGAASIRVQVPDYAAVAQLVRALQC